jgi:hypothetical protein
MARGGAQDCCLLFVVTVEFLCCVCAGVLVGPRSVCHRQSVWVGGVVVCLHTSHASPLQCVLSSKATSKAAICPAWLSVLYCFYYACGVPVSMWDCEGM